MNPISRRSVLQLSALGGVGGALMLSGCGEMEPLNPSVSGNGGDSDGTKANLVWWDHFGPLQQVQKDWFANFTKANPGITVNYQHYTAERMWQAIQVAKQSNQMPDVFTLAGADYPPAALIDQDWLQPIELSEQARAQLPKGSLMDGITDFGGKTYSFPLFSWRQHVVTWFNIELLRKAGLDPANPPRTYDEFRAAARAVAEKTDAAGFIWFLRTDVDSHIHDLAQAAGFEGADGVEYRTGKIALDSEPYLAVINFLHSLLVDKLMASASRSMDANQARLRFAAGEAAFWMEGPWCPGVLAKDAASFMDKLDVGPLLVPRPGVEVATYRPPVGGVFWLGQQSKQPAAASKVMSSLVSPEYAAKLAASMDQPPADLEAALQADVHPSWKKAVEGYQKSTFLAPSVAIKNSEESQVSSHLKPVSPGLHEIVEGLFAGKVTNLEAALRELSERATENRNQAIEQAKAKGAKVDESTYAFPNWKPREDYTDDKYVR